MRRFTYALMIAVLGMSFAPAYAEAPSQTKDDQALGQAFDNLIAAITQSKDFIEHHRFYQDPQNRASGMAFVTHMIMRTLERDVVQDRDYPYFRIVDFKTREGGDNPDQRYSFARIRGGETYRVWGRLGNERRIDFQVYAGTPWIKDAGRNASNLALEQMKFGKDRSFDVILSPTKVPGNWLANPPDGTEVAVRQVFSDWTNASPGEVHIDRVGYEGALKSVLTEAQMAAKLNAAAADLVATVEVWPDFLFKGALAKLPPNALTPALDPSAEGGVKGRWMSLGSFDLKDDEALILTTWPMSGNYQGVQLADLWFSSLEYGNRQTSLTADQAYKSRDGAYHFVISAQNPGVQNWLDTTGLHRGIIQLRYDGMTDATFPKDKEPTLVKVKFADLRKHLPADTPVFTPAMLTTVLAERRAHLQRRFGD